MSYLYIFKEKGTTTHKIGFSHNVEKRLFDLKSGRDKTRMPEVGVNRAKLFQLAVFPVASNGSAQELEEMAHGCFIEHMLKPVQTNMVKHADTVHSYSAERSEWFALEDSPVKVIENLVELYNGDLKDKEEFPF